jgi:hypothetical protein
MRKLILLLLAVVMIVPAAEAKRRESAEEIERKTRHYKGWEWGATGNFNLVFYDLEYTRIKGEKGVSDYQSQAKFGGSVMLNGGYFLNNHWKIGAEIGAQIQYNYTVMPIVATAHYYYGKRKTCLFNFLQLGTNVLFNKGLRFGALSAGGVGVRFQNPNNSYKIDLMVGYQALLLNPRPMLKGDFTLSPKDVNRKGLNQSVFIGIGVAF